MNKMIYYLHSNCVIVQGYLNSILVDMFRYRYISISNEAMQVLVENQGKNHFESLDDENYESFFDLIKTLEAEDFLSVKSVPKKTENPVWKDDVHDRSLNHAEIAFSMSSDLQKIDLICNELVVKNIFFNVSDKAALRDLLQWINQHQLFSSSNYIGIKIKEDLEFDDELTDLLLSNNRISELYSEGVFQNHSQRLDHINLFCSGSENETHAKVYVNPTYFNFRKNGIQPNKIFIDEQNYLHLIPMYSAF